MSLICSETGEMVREEEDVFVVKHPLGFGYAVSGLVVHLIPEADRRACLCDRFEEGLNVFKGMGIKRSGTWQISDLKPGRFLFSISEEKAKLHLPRTMASLAEDIAANAS